MRGAFTDLAKAIAGDVRQAVLPPYLSRRSSGRVKLNGVELELGSWASHEIKYSLFAGSYEGAEREVILASLRHDDVVLEVGSGAGYITAIAAGIARDVRSFEANPQMVSVAQGTVTRNGRTATVRNAVLAHAPTTESVQINISHDFWASSLLPLADSRAVDVPAADFATALRGCTYLIVDIEGAEVGLLGGAVPEVRAICVECHPAVVPPKQITEMLASLFAQGFMLDLDVSRPPVLYLHRD